jgi:iron complex outermembrane receptor protein
VRLRAYLLIDHNSFNKMKKSLLFITALSISLTTIAQTGQLKGKVSAANNLPLSGAVIQLSGGGKTITDGNGMFTIDCNNAKEITISHVGFGTYRQKISDCNENIQVLLDPSAGNLDEVDITASSISNKKLLYQPQSIVKLNELELKREMGLFLDDAININVPGVMMERRTVSAGQQFNIRGYGNGVRGTNGVNSNFDGQGSKVYLNGIPVTDAEGITLMDDIDFGSVSNVEVVKGPAGSLYGLAIAGVVNLETKKAAKNQTVIGQDAMVGNYGLQRYTTHLEIGGEHSSLMVNYGKQMYDGFMAHTASHKDFVNMTGDFQPNEKQKITTYVGYSNSYDQRNGELRIGQYDSLTYSGNPAYIANDAHSNVISYRAGVGHSYQFGKYVANNTMVYGTGVSSNVSSAGGWTDKGSINYGLRSTFDAKFNINDDYRLSGITGVEAQAQNAQILGYPMVKDSANLTGYNIIGAARSNQYTISKTYSVFTDWTLSMPHELFLTAGAGMSTMAIQLNDRFYVATNNNPSNPKGTHNPMQYSATYRDMYSPHLALNKIFNKQLSVYAAYSKGYKAPVSSYFFIPLTGQLNTDLKPEVGTQYELGSKGSLLNEKLFYQLAVFDAIFTNKMTVVAVPNATNTATSYTYVANGGTQDNKGLEILVKYMAYKSETGALSTIAPFVNFTYSDFKYKDFKFQQLSGDKKSIVETDYSGHAVAGIPPIVANAGVDVFTKYGFYGNVTYSYRDAMYFTSDEVNKTKAYSLVNAKIGFQHLFAKHFGVDVFYGANNMTSTQYPYMVFLNQLPDAYLPAPAEINFYGGLNLRYIF